MKQNLLFFSIIFLCFQHFMFSQSWESLGNPLMGNSQSNFGNETSYSADSNRLAVGAFTDSSTGDELGIVNTYQFSGANWYPYGEPLYGHEDNGKFGLRVALSGNGSMLVVSEHGFTGGGPTNKGAVYVYRWTGAAWVEDAVFYGINTQDFLGGSDVDISLDGNTVAIGSGNADVNGVLNAGQIRVYNRLGANNWVQVGAPINGGSENEYLGKVALNGDGTKLVVGGYGYFDFRGIVQVYELVNNNWSKVGEFMGDISGGQIGFSVSINEGGTVIAAATNQNSTLNLGGQCHLYKEDTLGDWLPYGSPLEDSLDEYYGYNISLNGLGDLLAVGDPDFVNDGPGKVFTYKDNGISFIPYNAVITGNNDDQIGYGLSFTPSGSRLSVGARNANDGNGKVQTYSDGILTTPEFNILEEIVIYPNPAKEFIHLQLPLSIPNVTVNIYDEMGRVLTTPQKIKNNDTIMLPFDDGVYFLKITFNMFSTTIKIIKTNN